MADTKHYSSVKKRLLQEKGPDIRKYGYNLSCGLGLTDGNISLEAMIQPLSGSSDPIDEILFARIKDELEKYLQDNNEKIPLNIQYTGFIRVRGLSEHYKS